MRAALFARYSSKMQDELSIEAQLAEMESFCKNQGWTVVQRYLLPETRSADVERSESFQAMISAAKRKEFDVLLIHKLDRFGRSRETSVTYKALLRRHGIQVRSVVENLDDSIFSRLIEGILEVVAEFYSLNLGQEIKKGQKQLTRRGFFRGGKVPWGFRKAPVQEGDRTHFIFEPDPVRAPIMEEVFRRVARGERTSDVLDWVKSRTGEAWSKPTLYGRLKNSAYCGILEYGKTSLPSGYGQKRRRLPVDELVQGTCPALVPAEVWEAANCAITARGARFHNRHPKRVFLLSEGVAKCARCGRNLVGSNFGSGKRPCYVCAGRREKLCTTRTVRAEDLEARVYQAVVDQLADVDAAEVIRRYEESLTPVREAAQRQEAALRRELNDVRRRKKNLLDMVEQEGFTGPDLTQRFKDLDTREAELAQEIGICQVQADESVRMESALVAEHIVTLADLMKEATPGELKGLYRALLEIEFDIEKQKGQLRLKLPLFDPREILLAPSGCIRDGRSGQT